MRGVRSALQEAPAATIVGVAWTLQHEIIFYVMFAFMIVNVIFGIVIICLWGLLVVIAVFVEIPWHALPLDKLSSAYNVLFFMGVAAAYFLRQWNVPAPRVMILIGSALFIFFGMLENMAVMDGYAIPARFAYGLSSMIILLGIVEVERMGSLKANGFSIILGKSSYSIYITQFIFIGIIWNFIVITDLKSRISPEITYLLIVAIAICFSIITSMLIERPLMKLMRRWIDRFYPNTAASASYEGRDHITAETVTNRLNP